MVNGLKGRDLFVGDMQMPVSDSYDDVAQRWLLIHIHQGSYLSLPEPINSYP